jgi:hypothetical protein
MRSRPICAAKTIGHSTGVSGVHFTTKVIPYLGIGEQIKDRVRISKGFPVGVAAIRKNGMVPAPR